MHIQSSVVRLDSRRKYKEVSSSSTKNINKQNYVFHQPQEQTFDSFHDNLSNLRNRFEQTQSIQVARLQDRMNNTNTIRQQMIDFLLQLIFGKNQYSEQAIETTYYHSEEEQTSLNAQASVVTADGRNIDISMTLELSSSFVEATSSFVNYQEPFYYDPLVINLDSPSANISDQTFLFDLNCDGKSEEISMTGAGSGFLVLDKNHDGIINDGNELFGATSGNGFADLASYDSDGNGWIDEADEIFDQLMIWTKDENGKDQLCALGKAGVGAIYLGCSSTEFTLRNTQTHEANAQIRKTGLFLYENGQSGTIQQVDLAAN